MTNADFNNYYPHTLKVDETVEQEHMRNRGRYELLDSRQINDYGCFFENIGIEYPEMVLGLKYKMAGSKAEKKNICENESRDASLEGRLYLRRDDWIDPDNSKYECGVFNLDGTRQRYNRPPNNPRKYPSKELCSKYYDKNQGYDFYTKMIPSKLDNPVIDLRPEEVEPEIKNNAKSKIFWITYLLISGLIIYWTMKYHVEKPYAFYDYIHSFFINKAIFIILIFGAIIYLFCPFDTCYHNADTPLYRRDLNKVVKNVICDYTKNNTSYLEESVCNKYDNSSWFKKLDKVISVLFNLNRKIEKPCKFINNQVCNYCKVTYPCIDRSPYNIIQIITPVIITVYSNDLIKDSDTQVRNYTQRKQYLNAINIKYKYTDESKPYDTSTIIYLKTNDDHNNKLFMCCLSMYGNSTNISSSGIDGSDYSYNWIEINDRNGPTIYNENINNLRLKYCPFSYRIFCVATNYELIGYNISLSISKFIDLFSKNKSYFKEYPYFPNFNILSLKQDKIFKKNPEFIQRKLIKIYKYLISHPSQKLRTKNISIINGNIYRYDTKLPDNIIVSDQLIKDYFLKINIYIQQCNQYIIKLKEINNYHNDDEDDNNYLTFYNTKHMEKSKDYYLTANYDFNLENIYEKIKINSDNEILDDFMYNLNFQFPNLNYVQRDIARNKITDKLMEKFNKIKNEIKTRPSQDLLSPLEFLYNKKNIILGSSKSITVKDGNYNIKINEHFIVQEIVNEHDFNAKTHQQDGIINECICCNQQCKME